MVTEYHPYPTLDIEINNYQFNQKSSNDMVPESLIWNYFIQIGLGIQFLHANNIVHRAIMPKNICMLDEMGKNVKIRGFEDAILEDDIKKNTWQIDPSWCTAPELAAPHGYSMYDSRVDLWSLGCICY